MVRELVTQLFGVSLTVSAIQMQRPHSPDAASVKPASGALESSFRDAYQKRYGKPLREFRDLGHGQYLINGIQIAEAEVQSMLRTIENELAKQKVGMVQRLIKFFGGKTDK